MQRHIITPRPPSLRHVILPNIIIIIIIIIIINTTNSKNS